MKANTRLTLGEMVEGGLVELTRGKVISRKDMVASPGSYPVYSSAKDNDGKFGEYGKYMFDEDLITWSVDGGGRLFFRPKHRYSVTNVGGILRILKKDKLDYKYLYYALSLRHSEIRFDWVKKAHPSVIKKLYRDIPIPSLPEQKRIVGILDKAFQGIDTAKANTEANLENAGALFESHLHDVFMRHDASHVVRKLDDVCEEITVGHVGSMVKHYRDEGIPFLRSQNIRPFQVSLDNVVYINEAFHKSLKKSQLRPGDVAVVRTGYPGTAAVIPGSLPISNCSDLVIVRPGPLADAHYLTLFFNSRLGKEMVAGRIVGAAQKHFNVTAAKQVAISFPPVPEQRRLVSKIQKFGIETQRLESIYQRKLDSLEALKKSLLYAAFSGKL